MSHEIAKLLLEHAESVADRSEAVKTALSLGMPLQEIEAYLDWLDAVRPPRAPGSAAADSSLGTAENFPEDLV